MSDGKPMDRRQAEAIAEAMLEQPRQTEDRQRPKRPDWRGPRPAAAAVLAFFGGRLLGEAVFDGAVAPLILGATLAAAMLVGIARHHHRRGAVAG